MSVLARANCICYPKKFRAIVGENFVSVRDTSSVEHRVYTRPLIENAEKYLGGPDPLIMIRVRIYMQ